MTTLEIKAVLAKACIDVMKSKQADDRTRMLAATTAIELAESSVEKK